MVGACWNCKIMPVRMINAEGDAFSSDAAEAIYYAVDNGARVINASWGIAPGVATPAELEPIRDAILYAAANDVVFVAAAGNSGTQGLYFPASMPETIAVGSSNWKDVRSDFSSYALGTEVLDVMAPGELIWSSGVLSAYDAWVMNNWLLFPELWWEPYRPGDDTYVGADGTSFAAPLVSGYVGLILSRNPCATVADVRGTLRNNAVDIGTPGYDAETGFGRIRMVVPDLGCETQDAPPTVTVSDPQEGATVAGLVEVAAVADDDNEVTQVEFLVDGVSIGVDSDGTDGWAQSWATTDVADGSHGVTATATDSVGQTASDSISVQVDNVNDPPTASFSYSCTLLDCSFDASASSDPDGTLSNYDWTFGDGNTGSGVTTAHSYAAGGTYSAQLTVTDNRGATDTSVRDIVVTDARAHVGDLDVISGDEPRNRWGVTVTISVHDADHQPLANAAVSGSWTAGITGDASCATLTDAAGRCTLVRNDIKSNVSSVTFRVGAVSLAGYPYHPADNHDPDGDSDGTTITAAQPGANESPVTTIGSPTDGAAFAAGENISFIGSATDPEDGDISASLVWASDLDGPIGTGSSFSSTLSEGIHAVTATATDSAGESGSDSVTVSVGDAAAVVVHVADLDGSSTQLVRARWSASVTIGVRDTIGQAVANANVTGSWSAGARGSGGCTTDASGLCATSKGNIKSSVPSVTFTVEGITGTGITYDAAANSDPDGDSDGTTIIVNQ